MQVAAWEGAGRRRAAKAPPDADGLVAGAPGARDLPLVMAPGTAGGARRAGARDDDWDERVEEQGPFLAPDSPPRDRARR